MRGETTVGGSPQLQSSDFQLQDHVRFFNKENFSTYSCDSKSLGKRLRQKNPANVKTSVEPETCTFLLACKSTSVVSSTSLSYVVVYSLYSYGRLSLVFPSYYELVFFIPTGLLNFNIDQIIQVVSISTTNS